MTRPVLKEWAKQKIKGEWPNILVASLIAGIITGISIPTGIHEYGEGMSVTTSIPIGFIFYFIEVGFIYFMINFINGKKPKFEDLFKYKDDFAKDLGTALLMYIFVCLFLLLFIIPGIIKGLAYSLVPYLLGDKKYKDLSPMEILKKSEEMMYGHKTDLFVLGLSFIGWYILSILTCGILFIWVIPYVQTATVKFLYDIKEDYEKSNGSLKDTLNDKAEEVKEAIEEKIDEKKEEVKKEVKKAKTKAKEKVEDAADKVIDKVDEI